ncbi:hypothetical protein DM02DRAFT_656104 [Periconia macrospinosa]|uniref:Uncharacterized protein n=1 Tax=Periconia macrospinosa TaxID=97972 RepID=A0A2V1DNJ9_9PLEO|nr:hypothetical protein DM02DRAFT_656104 [Periconia macrospinosa]
MRATFFISALLSATAAVSALPTSLVQRGEYCDKSPSDGRAATIFKQQDFAGDRIATDYVSVPVTDDFCFSLNSFFGGWTASTRSLIVNDGYKCEFYNQSECGGEPLCLSGQGEQSVQHTLPEGFDSAIVSLQCRAL